MSMALYPGTFDPLTNGHTDIAMRAAKLFEKVIVAVADSSRKRTLFSVQERVAMAKQVLSANDRVEVVSFNSLVTDFARDNNVVVIVRGIRAVSDFDYEFQMTGMNRQLYSGIETVFLIPAENLGYTTSGLVREIASLGGDVSKFVHKSVAAALKNKFV